MHQVDVGYPFATVFLIAVVGQSIMLKGQLRLCLIEV